MPPAQLPASEAQRLACLFSYDVLDTECEAVFDGLTKLAAKMTASPTACISLVADKRQWFKSRVGLDVVETPRDVAFCSHALLNPNSTLVVPDAQSDARFADNPLVTGPPKVRFYAGTPLVSPEGHALGTLCVMDYVPRDMDADQQETLATLARAVMTTLELRRTVAQTAELALTDSLTGLPNRRAFNEVVRRAVSRLRQDGEPFGLLYLDLDGFKGVNDQNGHEAGDSVLRDVAACIAGSVRRDDQVARLGGDEFAVLLSGANALSAGETVREAIQARMVSRGWPVTASVGAASFVSVPASDAEAMATADAMMYAAKVAGKNRVRHTVFGAAEPLPLPTDAVAEESLFETPDYFTTLLNAGGLRNYYQPVIDLQTGAVSGVEVLARLVDHGDIFGPGDFLPGFSAQTLRTLLFEGLAQGLHKLADCSGTHPNLTLGLNVDPLMFLQEDFADTVLATLAAAAVSPGRIVLEILEGGEILNLESACDQMRTLRAQGIKIALDDVGSGHSSLMRIKSLPIDIIKMEQAFVRGLRQTPSDLVFIANMMSLAKGLDVSFIVEGAETPEILDALRVLGVAKAQGYAIAMPMPGDALPSWLAAYTAEPAAGQPTSLLGAYASHMNTVNTCRALIGQPLDVRWLNQAQNPHRCMIGRYFDQNGLHDTEYGLLHKKFHTTLPYFYTNNTAWESAAEAFRRAMETAIRSGSTIARRAHPKPRLLAEAI